MATGSSCATKRLQRAAWHVACFAWRARLRLLAHALAILSTVEIWWYHCRGVSVYLCRSLRAQLLPCFQRLAEDGAAKAGIQKYNLCCLSKYLPTAPQHIRDGILEYNPCHAALYSTQTLEVLCEAVDSIGRLIAMTWTISPGIGPTILANDHTMFSVKKIQWNTHHHCNLEPSWVSNFSPTETFLAERAEFLL